MLVVDGFVQVNEGGIEGCLQPLELTSYNAVAGQHLVVVVDDGGFQLDVLAGQASAHLIELSLQVLEHSVQGLVQQDLVVL